MDEPNQALEPVYGPNDLSTFAKIVCIPEFPAQSVRKLQRAGWVFRFMSYLDKMGASRHDQRKALKRIHKSALEFKEALEHYALMIIYEKPDLPFSEIPILDDLAQAASVAAGQVGRTGADPRLARYVFVRDLGQIYKEVTGKRPTLRRKPEGEPSGPFFEFVEAALRPLDKHAVQGVESDVAKVVACMKKLDP